MTHPGDGASNSIGMRANGVGANGANSQPVDSRAADAAQILSERARRYADTSALVEAREQVEVMLFKLGTDQYAVESRLLRSVQSTKGLTAVPCTPAQVAGILNVRGEIVTVLDLGIVLGLTGASREANRTGVLLVELPQIRVGLLVDEVLGVRGLAIDGLDRAPSGREFARGVAESNIVLVDLGRLVGGGDFDVFEDVS